MTTIPQGLLEAASGSLPCYVVDPAAVKSRVASILGVTDSVLYPVKANPHPAVVAAALTGGAGLDLCSRGDLAIALDSGAPLQRCSFTSAHLDEKLAHDLVALGVHVDLDSAAQADLWVRAGGREAGVRVCTASTDTPYGSKFGVVASDVLDLAGQLASGGCSLTGVHVHDAHVDRTPQQMAERLLELLTSLPDEVWPRVRRVNLGGGWPMQQGLPTPLGGIEEAIRRARQGLKRRGFAGSLVVEPGEWVVGPCGWLVASVSAVKPHPSADGLIVVLDTATPVPCRPSEAPFVLVRNDEEVTADDLDCIACDIHGSANTGLDTVGLGVDLPAPEPGDVLISCGQGAYARQLTGTFNERAVPPVILL